MMRIIAIQELVCSKTSNDERQHCCLYVGQYKNRDEGPRLESVRGEREPLERVTKEGKLLVSTRGVCASRLVGNLLQFLGWEIRGVCDRS